MVSDVFLSFGSSCKYDFFFYYDGPKKQGIAIKWTQNSNIQSCSFKQKLSLNKNDTFHWREP